MTCQSSPRLQVAQNSAHVSANRLNDSALSPLELARRLAFTRREFLRSAAEMKFFGDRQEITQVAKIDIVIHM